MAHVHARIAGEFVAELPGFLVKMQILNQYPDIKDIQYVSKDDALLAFTQKHQDNPTFSKALAEVGDNPFLPSLNINTNGNADEYAQITNILQSSQYSNIIEKVDFSQKKDTIEKVFSLISNINLFGLILAAILVLIVILVVFNTMRLVINNSKEEISVMRIVGASSWFIRAPFVIEGAFFGLISFVICFVVTILFAWFLTSGVSVILPGFSLFRYFISNLWIILLLQLGAGVGLGAISTWIVVRKYLQI
jgi:cell division transport system permease protein